MTSLQRKNDLIEALLKEIGMRRYEIDEPIATVYFGGGTPSLLTEHELQRVMSTIRSNFRLDQDAEITFESNPDDIDEGIIQKWKQAGINRLSIGVQSFFDDDLLWMNRAHSSAQSMMSLELARKHFDNITIDLIYGTPLLDDEKWYKNLQTAKSFGIPHLSCYALTVEAKTPLQKMIALKKCADVDADRQSQQFFLLMEWAENAGYEHYEISNFALPGYRSRHNSSYWEGKKYIGIGPSAHSYDGDSRQWNISNNTIYIDKINSGIIPSEKESLTSDQKLNEYIMTSLRTIEGLDLSKIDHEKSDVIKKAAGKYFENGLLKIEDDRLFLTRSGKLFADGIASDLFFV